MNVERHVGGILRRLLLAGLLFLLPESAGRAEGQVAVQLQSGRKFNAAIDARSNDARLWLRFGDGRLIVLRPIDWNHVASGTIDGRPLGHDEFKTAALRIAADARQAVATGGNGKPPLGAEETEVRVAPPAAAQYCPRLQAIHIDAYVANWDDDVEVDGLVVHLHTLAEDGGAANVRGTLMVEAFGESSGRGPDRPAVGEIDRWSQAVEPDDFGPNGAVYRLEFLRRHPEFDLDIGPFALVHAELTAPGHGTFEDSQSTVRVRPYSAFRDRLQQDSGQRFLSQERTGPGH